MKASITSHTTKTPEAQTWGQERIRKPHVVADRTSRVLKARKIVSIIGSSGFLHCRRILEVGCGSGLIASTLAKTGTSDLSVDAVDVVDSRVEKNGYSFNLVHDTSLPFEDDSFDLVITNHVIEHVGDEQAQLAHLAEVKRVTANDGTIYFAMPNKWRLVEPHYRLPLLSWFPRSASDAYLRLTRRAPYYDCLPHGRRNLIRLFKITGLAYEDRTVAAMRHTLALEHPAHLATKIVKACPDWLLSLAEPVIPTFVFLLRKS
jgi:2-polyprenyl-3-methyl-5-hydroxy-6-metoxy-1,4-benzoquinol methylase